MRELSKKGLYTPESLQSKEVFYGGTIRDIAALFAMNSEGEQKTIGFFLTNTDHGLEHEYNVYQKAIQIADDYEKLTGKKVRKHLIYPMAICHDAMRSVKYSDDDPRKLQKEKRNDSNHEKYGAILFQKLIKKAEGMGYNISFSDDEKSDIIEYLINHDYFSQQLNGRKFHEPQSLEGQIVRLADRISVPLRDEIQRYWDTGKRLGTPFFNPDMPLEEREKTSFDTMRTGLYGKNGRMDEVLFFTALLMITEKDFADPILGAKYTEWAIQKQDAVKFILEIADAENASSDMKNQLKDLLEHLGKKFGFTVGQS